LEVTAVTLMILLAWPTFVSAVLLQSGFFEWQYGSEFPQLLKEADHSDADAKGQSAEKDAVGTANKALARARWQLWVGFLCFPLNIATILLLPRLLSDTLPYQLGLTTHRLGRNLLLGFLGWLLVTAPVLAINYYVHLLYQLSTGVQPTIHSLTVLSESHPGWWESALLVLSAIVAAPVGEELLYRGMLQRWFSRRSWGGWLAWCLALAVALGKKYDLFASASDHHDWSALGLALQPAAFVCLLSPALWLAGMLRRPQVARAVIGTSLLWAVLHSDSWPDPVALFVLGLCVGWLAHRTRSLVGPFAFHSLFNAVACVSMFL
jgi:membrane protease YdiL (CAAX protease family)